MTESLADWLMVQLAADEQAVITLANARVTDELLISDRPIHDWILRGPGTEREMAARVLADIAGKRSIVNMHIEGHDCPGLDDLSGYYVARSTTGWPYPYCDTLKLLALPYDDRSGFQESWRP